MHKFKNREAIRKAVQKNAKLQNRKTKKVEAYDVHSVLKTDSPSHRQSVCARRYVGCLSLRMKQHRNLCRHKVVLPDELNHWQAESLKRTGKKEGKLTMEEGRMWKKVTTVSKRDSSLYGDNVGVLSKIEQNCPKLYAKFFCQFIKTAPEFWKPTL